MHEMIDSLEALLKKDIQKVIAKGDITPQDYQCLDTAVDIYKDLETIRAMEEYHLDENGVSGMVSGRMYPQHVDYNHSWGYEPSNGGNSYGRGRSSMTGRYISRDDEVGMKLNQMMQTAQTEQERMTIQRLMNELGR